MPSVSKSQQRLMGMAYSVKKGDTKLSDIDAEFRDEIKNKIRETEIASLTNSNINESKIKLLDRYYRS